MPPSTLTRAAGAVLVAACAWLLALAVTAQAHPPAASFTYTPDAPLAGQTVQFVSTTTPEPQHTDPLQLEWDLDNDGQFDDGTGATASRAYPAGDHVVRLRAHYTPGAAGAHEDIAARTVHVVVPAGTNQPPVAAIDPECSDDGNFKLCAGLLARENEPHTFDASLSSDSDGTIVKHEWNLDGTGGFEVNSGTAATVTHTFERFKGLIDPGTRKVRLRVTDDDGATAETTITLTLLEPRCEQIALKGRIRATGMCLRRRSRTVDGHKVVRFYSKAPVKLGGMTITPRAGNVFTLDLPDEPGAPAPRIAATAATVKVDAPGGPVKLVDGPFAWQVKDGIHLSGFEAGGGARLNGLKVTAVTPAPELGLGGTSSRIGLRLALPSQFGGVTSDDPVFLTPGKATASAAAPLRFEVPNAAIGPIGLNQLVVTFDGEDLWEIAAGITLPPPIPTTIDGDAGIRDGAFEHAGAGITFRPQLGLGPVFLQRIAFRIEIKPKKSKCVPKIGKEVFNQRKIVHDITGYWYDLPNIVVDHGIPTFALCGEVELTGGPEVLGAAAIRLNAGLGLATYDDRPAVLRAHGKIDLVEIPLAKADLELHTNGYMRMRARFSWGIPAVATLKGMLMFEMLAPKFNAQAYVDACLEFVDWCAGARAVVSSKGVAVCLKIDLWVDDWEPGFGYRWGEGFPTLYFAGCDVGEYKEHIKSPIDDHITVEPARAGSAKPERSFDLPAGLPGATLVVRGDGGLPKVTLMGPNGERITSPDDLRPVVRKPFLVMKDPRANLTQFAIAHPSAGRWRVVVEPGSAPVLSIASANGLEQPKIDAKVVGHGHRQTLRYRVAPVAGQKVTFLERGATAGKRIGDATGARGSLRFRPADGKAERRQIVALVTQDGKARGEYPVTRYRAPGPLRPARPRNLSVTRRGTTLRLRWKAARPADLQQVTVRLGDGRRILERTHGSRLVVRGVRRGVRARVAVRGVLRSGLLGRPAIARVGGRVH